MPALGSTGNRQPLCSMPKKHHKPSPKPSPPVHPSLSSFSSSSHPNHSRRHSQHGPAAGHSPAQPRSVNDLIRESRRSQLARDPAAAAAVVSMAQPQTVHPSLRPLLRLQEPPPLRSYAGVPGRVVRPVGDRRDVSTGQGMGPVLRPAPGPAAPRSWMVPAARPRERGWGRRRGRGSVLEESSGGLAGWVGRGSNENGMGYGFRLDRLPGIQFPPAGSMLDTALRTMAVNWHWHLRYDGVFLAELPTTVKVVLLSYVAAYADHEAASADDLQGHMHMHMHGFKLLFPEHGEDGRPEVVEDVVRLDLAGALGRWFSLKQLGKELCRNPDRAPAAQPSAPPPLPWDSWEDEATAAAATALPTTITVPFHFPNLTSLSLARPPPQAASWPGLLRLLPDMPLLTHLSLAYWPEPTLTPRPTRTPWCRGGMKTGTNDLDEGDSDGWNEKQDDDGDDDNAAYAAPATVLRRLSRATYCLRWLDLQGCTRWVLALAHPAGPEWNGAWRDVGWLGVEAGWFPDLGGLEEAARGDDDNGDDDNQGEKGEKEGRQRHWEEATLQELLILVRRQCQAYRRATARAERVARGVRETRIMAKGKWIEVSVSTGSEQEEEQVRARALGA